MSFFSGQQLRSPHVIHYNFSDCSIPNSQIISTVSGTIYLQKWTKATICQVVAVLWSIHGFPEFSLRIFSFLEYMLQMKSAAYVLLQLPLISKITSSKFIFCKEHLILQVPMLTYKADSTEQILSCNWKLLQSRKPLRYNMSLQQMLPGNLQYHLQLLFAGSNMI